MSRFNIRSCERLQFSLPFDIEMFSFTNCQTSFTHTDDLGNFGPYVYICEEASQTLLQHIGWGNDTIYNQVEQGGMMFGRFMKDNQKRADLGYVTHCLPAKTDGSMKHLVFPHSAWKKVLGELDELNALRSSEEELVLLGWYHTHPKHLRVYMSETDRRTQAKFFYQPWHFSIVLNPQQRIWKVFYGEHSLECLGYMANTEKYV